MRDTTLCQHLLGIEHHRMGSKVELDTANQLVEVSIEHAEGVKWRCRECGAEGMLRDHADQRVWRDLDSRQFQTFLHAYPQWVRFLEYGVRQLKLPWTEPTARFTMLFKRFVIEVLGQTCIQVARKILGIGWDEAWHVLHRSVEPH